MKKKIFSIFLIFILLFSLVGCSAIDIEDIIDFSEAVDENSEENISGNSDENVIDIGGRYTSKDDVALYIMTYNKLPDNFITKKEAKKLGWDNSKGNLWEVTDNKSIGGDIFGNFEEKLPDATGRKWYECDINYSGGFRNGERIVYSNDGLIFYTEDHYETFTKLN